MSPPDVFAASDAAPAGVGGAVFTARQIGVATLLGSPIAGGVLLAINARRLGLPAARALGSVALLVAGIVVASLVLPERVPGAAYSLAGFFATRSIAEAEQGPAIARHLGGGGEQGSWAVAVVVGLVPLVLFAGLVTLLVATELGAR